MVYWRYARKGKGKEGKRREGKGRKGGGVWRRVLLVA